MSEPTPTRADQGQAHVGGAAAIDDEREISPMLKIGLELGPLLIYFLSFNWLKDPDDSVNLQALIEATGIFIVVMAVAQFVNWRLTGKLARMAVITLLVVVFMGGLTYFLQDETFLKMRPTLVNLGFAGVLGFGLLRGQSYLQYLMGELLPLDSEGWTKLTRNWAIYFVCVAVVNEIVWRSFDTDTWFTVKTFAYPAVAFAFMMSQAPLITKHALEEEGGEQA